MPAIADLFLILAIVAALGVLAVRRRERNRHPPPAPEEPPPPEPASSAAEPPSELTTAWVQFLLDHVRHAVSAINNRLNVIARAADEPELDAAVRDQITLEVRRAANVAQELMNRINARRIDIARPPWTALTDGRLREGHILVVEDDDSNRAAITRLFRRAGHRVTPAANGVEARDVLSAETVDCVVCDLHMPTMGGRAFYEQLLESHPVLARRFVFVTGDYASPDAYEFLSRTGQPVIAKPYEVEELLTAVATVLGQVGVVAARTADAAPR